MNSENALCPCHSGKSYRSCCQRYHRGELPENALALMRSRYAAYALDLASYIISTTHLDSPYQVSNKKQWIKDIHHFSMEAVFEGLEILSYQEKEESAFVTFIAYLKKGKKDLSFTEKSRFKKVGKAWLYLDGKLASGKLSAEQANQL